eukprot:TRINITY_DN2097_c0_g2_i2.p1 TRINITY_DN2097_c0_g2~~TRINITY_DN2097_c0_g2_i2.p1  ORF type:complete len:405 (+),score=82.60 TRINITY_DN2097_c0_g2_i2:114-1328(+)
MPRFLFVFVHRWNSFRLPELEAVADLLKIPYRIVPHEAFNFEHSPFMYLDLAREEDAVLLAKRIVTVRIVLEVWADGSDYPALFENLKRFPAEEMQKHSGPEHNFKFFVEGFGRRYTMEQQLEIINRFEVLPFQSKACMKNPARKYWVIEDIGVEHEPSQPLSKDTPVKWIYFGREVAEGRRDLVDRHTLKKREFIGPTSMNSELSSIMANLVQADVGRFIFDPFVGTGSILISCAEFGAHTIGGDIDIRILKGKQGKNLLSNFMQYKLSPVVVDQIRCDNAISPIRPDIVFDGIVADPPYGLRAGAKKAGSKKESAKPIPKELLEGHIPQCKPYELDECLEDLLKMAESRLAPGGRVVFWIPEADGEVPPTPSHPLFDCLSESHQYINRVFSRRLVVMRKKSE